jgi:hypothetical protein
VTGGSIVTRDNSGCVPTKSGVIQSKNSVLIHYTCALSPDEVKRHSVAFFFFAPVPALCEIFLPCFEYFLSGK